VGLASARLDALVFLLGIMLGTFAFNELFGFIQPLYDGAHAGRLFLHDTLAMPREAVVFALCLAAVIAFAGCTRIENRTGLPGVHRPAGLKYPGIAALILVVAAGGLLVIPRQPQTPGAGAIAGIGRPLFRAARAEDYIGPLDVSERLMKGEEGLLPVDLRPPAAYERFHMRGAVNVPLESLENRAGIELPRNRPIVLIDDMFPRTLQAWMQLRHRGWKEVRMLSGGLQGFWRECLTPPSLAGATDPAAAATRSAAYRARRDFFLGKSDVPDD
jgi:rhodanese-related sulfurtransferase